MPASFGPGFTFSLDLPGPDHELDPGMFVVAGWALHRPEPLDWVDIHVDGRSVGRARRGIYRSDLAATFGDPSVAICGYELLVERTELGVRDGMLELELFGSAGDRTEKLFGGTFRVAPGRIDRPNLATAHVSAHMHPDGTGPRTVSPAPGGEVDLVVFTHDLNLGGAQLWLQELLLKAEAGRRFPCTVVAFDDGPLRASLSELGIAVRLARRPPVDDPKAYEQGVLELVESLLETNHNCALVNTLVSFPGADACIRRGIPVVWGIHESLRPRAFFVATYQIDPDPAVLRALDQALAQSNALVFESEATRRIYQTKAAPNRSVVVQYGVDTELIDRYAVQTPAAEARARLAVDSAARVALVMGSIEPRKAQTIAVEAFTRVARDHPSWMLAMVGDRHSPYSGALKEYALASGLGDRIRVLPVTDEPFLWYRASDVLLSTSDLESLPRSMLESMCFGVPPVASSVFGIPELIEDGKDGFLFAPNDAGACARALSRVFGLEAAHLAEVGTAARAHVRACHDSRSYSAAMLELIESCAAHDPRSPEQVLSGR